MRRLRVLFLFLHKKRFLHFFATGVTGIVLNILTVWLFTEFVFGIDYYLIGYVLGAVVNVTYNFTLHTIMTFQTRQEHAKRFIRFLLFSFLSACVQVVIIRALTEYFGREYYLPIIAGTILLLSLISFVFFKHSLFNENQEKENIYATPAEEFAVLRSNVRMIASRMKTFLSKDKNVLIVIFILAVLTRLPLLNYPDRTVFDEVVYVNFAAHIIHQIPFFDIHPPLARMIFAEVADNAPFALQMIPLETNRQFGDFPYETLRFFIAMLGILLPPLLYVIGRLLRFPLYAAGILALFAVFDNALVLYSRLILPDTILLLLNFLGFAAALAAVQTSNTRDRIILVLLSGIALGLAVSIKWTALAMLPIIWVVFLFARNYRAIAVTGILALCSYLFIFSVYFTNFPAGGRIDATLYPHNKTWISDMSFPNGTQLKDIVLYLPQMHELILRANRDPYIAKELARQSPGPLTWPTAQSSMIFWISEDGKRTIRLHGNEFLRVMTFFMILFEIGWVTVQSVQKRRWPIDKTETILILGYILNYVPFFFIDRPMYPYHYFIAFIFLLLLIPRIAPRIKNCIDTIANDKVLARIIIFFSIFFVVMNFFLEVPTTYGL